MSVFHSTKTKLSGIAVDAAFQERIIIIIIIIECDRHQHCTASETYSLSTLSLREREKRESFPEKQTDFHE